MFTIIETIYDAGGNQLGSDSFEEYATEAEANASVERHFKEHGHADDQGNYTRWHVEAI